MLSRIYDRHLAPAGVNLQQFALLCYVAEDPGVATAALASKMGMDRTTLVRALKPLRATGLIDGTLEAGPDLRYRLTEKGLGVRSVGYPRWMAAQEEYEKLVGQEKAAAIRDGLMTMTADV
jgi:DNA-binding MarR family transcriptional regulator